MSYILDAIRKSEQQRRHGAAPTLPGAPFPPAAEETPIRWIYPALALGLGAAGFAIGWMRPWQASEPVAKSPDFVAAPRPVPRELPRALPAPRAPARVVQQAPPKPLPAPAPAAAPAAPAPPQPPAAVVPYAELPVTLRQQLPPMKVSVHAYSRTPSERLVDVNDRLLHEGDTLAPGLVLEAITPEGMVFNYQGTRFSRGVGIR